MKLTKETVAKLKLEDGKSDQIWFDDDLPGFGVRLRAGGKAVWVMEDRNNNNARMQITGVVDSVEPNRKLAISISAAETASVCSG